MVALEDILCDRSQQGSRLDFPFYTTLTLTVFEVVPFSLCAVQVYFPELLVEAGFMTRATPTFLKLISNISSCRTLLSSVKPTQR